MDGGGALSHHHGIGYEHAAWLPAELIRPRHRRPPRRQVRPGPHRHHEPRQAASLAPLSALPGRLPSVAAPCPSVSVRVPARARPRSLRARPCSVVLPVPSPCPSCLSVSFRGPSVAPFVSFFLVSLPVLLSSWFPRPRPSVPVRVAPQQKSGARTLPAPAPCHPLPATFSPLPSPAPPSAPPPAAAGGSGACRRACPPAATSGPAGSGR